MSTRIRKLASSAAALLIAISFMPIRAFAASNVNVEGTDYSVAANGNGSNGGTWVWDGVDLMSLDSYDGGAIRAVGDLIVDLKGNNTVSNTGGSTISVDSGDLTITGDGSLTATTTGDMDRTGTIVANGGDVNITDTTVTVDSQKAGQ